MLKIKIVQFAKVPAETRARDFVGVSIDRIEAKMSEEMAQQWRDLAKIPPLQ